MQSRELSSEIVTSNLIFWIMLIAVGRIASLLPIGVERRYSDLQSKRDPVYIILDTSIGKDPNIISTVTEVGYTTKPN